MKEGTLLHILRNELEDAPNPLQTKNLDIMAIEHTQGKFLALNPIELDGTLTDEVSIIVTEPKQQTICKLDGNNKKANAALICDAVNNTANKGIDPNAVPGMLRALQGIWQWNNNRVKGNTLPFPATLLDSAIKSSKLK